jgi:predicted metal-dependent phosphoesterase TrpH
MTAPNEWVRVDCHLHTVASGDAVLTLEQLAEGARRNGLDVVCVTDHNETSAAFAAAGRDLGVRIVVGEEIRTPDGDVIGLFLTERIPYVLPLAEVVARIRAQGGLVYVPHPFDLQRSSLGEVLPGLCERGDVDVIEVFNAKVADQALNDQAAALAAAYGLPGGAGSDAHDPAGVGAAYLEMPAFDGPDGFLAALPRARITGEYRPHAIRYPRRAPALQADAGGQPLAVVGGVAQVQLARLGPLEVQVGVVLPGEADPAVDLDVLRGHVEVGLRGVRLGQRGQHRDLRRPLGHRGGRVADG